MSGERKRSVAEWPKLPRLSSTLPFATDAFSASAEQCPLCADSDRQPSRDRLTLVLFGRRLESAVRAASVALHAKEALVTLTALDPIRV